MFMDKLKTEWLSLNPVYIGLGNAPHKTMCNASMEIVRAISRRPDWPGG